MKMFTNATAIQRLLGPSNSIQIQQINLRRSSISLARCHCWPRDTSFIKTNTAWLLILVSSTCSLKFKTSKSISWNHTFNQMRVSRQTWTKSKRSFSKTLIQLGVRIQTRWTCTSVRGSPVCLAQTRWHNHLLVLIRHTLTSSGCRSLLGPQLMA